jgi:hypothetical protein
LALVRVFGPAGEDDPAEFAAVESVARAVGVVRHLLDVDSARAVEDVLELVRQHRADVLLGAGDEFAQVQALRREVEIRLADRGEESDGRVAGAFELTGPLAAGPLFRGEFLE